MFDSKSENRDKAVKALRVRVRVRVMVRSRGRGGGVTSKEIDRTWMCDSMETRDAAPRVYRIARSRETKDSALHLSGV